MFDKKILSECYGDTLLVKQLGYPDPNGIHQGIGEVANLMKKYYNNTLVVGIIDNDKNKPTYFDSFKRIRPRSNSLQLLKHNSRKHYLIIVTPAFEKWIIAAGEAIGVTRQRHNLPEDFNRFRKITKDSHLHTNSKFHNYLNNIIQNNSPYTFTMQSWLREILR